MSALPSINLSWDSVVRQVKECQLLLLLQQGEINLLQRWRGIWRFAVTVQCKLGAQERQTQNVKRAKGGRATATGGDVYAIASCGDAIANRRGRPLTIRAART